MNMHKWNKVDPHNLDYIKKQVEAIKETNPISSEKETEIAESRTVADILEEQLITLKEMQQTLKNIETSVAKKSWKRFL